MGFPDIKGFVDGAIQRGRQLGQDALQTGEQLVDKGKQLVGEGVHAAKDAFEQVEQKAEPLVELVTGRSPDLKFDGDLVDKNGNTYPPGTPVSQVGAQDPSRPTVIFVNGAGTDVGGQVGSMNVIAGKTGANVVGIHNATQGLPRDLGQCVLDWIDKGKNPPVDTLADTVYSELQAGRPVHLMAHSQGAIITSRAIEDVKSRLMAEDGLTKEQAEAKLSKVQVETFGGGAAYYPDGPQYVHYVNRFDPVAAGVGLGVGLPGDGAGAGKGAVVHYFNDNQWSLQNHSLNTTYMNARVPFDQARRGDFTKPKEPGL